MSQMTTSCAYPFVSIDGMYYPILEVDGLFIHGTNYRIKRKDNSCYDTHFTRLDEVLEQLSYQELNDKIVNGDAKIPDSILDYYQKHFVRSNVRKGKWWKNITIIDIRVNLVYDINGKGDKLRSHVPLLSVIHILGSWDNILAKIKESDGNCI